LPSIYALLGRHDISDDAADREANWINRTMSAVFVHDGYNKDATEFKSTDDIAIFRMAESVAYTKYIQPICLPLASASTAERSGDVVGYGRGDVYDVENTPKKAKLRSINTCQCLNKGGDYSKIVSEKSFCANHPNVAPCLGDSGGAFNVKNSVTRRYEVLGIVSFALSKECRLEDWTVFVEVPSYGDWIRESEYQ
jgi:secreted trypsin-like serine protease